MRPDAPPQADVYLLHARDTAEHVESLAGILRAFGLVVRTNDIVDLSSGDLEDLDRVFDEAARVIVCMLSEQYESSGHGHPDFFDAHVWAYNELASKFVGIRLDLSELPGLGHQCLVVENDARDMATSIAAIKARLDDSMAEGEARGSNGRKRVRVPRHDEGRQWLVRERPDGWKAAYLASALREQLERCEWKWDEHRLGLRREACLHFSRNQAEKFLQGMVLSDLQQFLGDFSSRVDVMRRSEGNPARMESSVDELVAVYEAVLDWAARIRGASTPPNWRVMVETTAQLADSLLVPVRDFAETYCEMAENLLNGESGEHMNLTMKFDLDSRLTDIIFEEYKRIH